MTKDLLFRFIRKTTICLFGVIFISMSSCEVIKKWIPIIGSAIIDSVNNVNVVLDNTTNNLNANAANYGAIMQEAIDKITDMHIKEQLQDALNNAIITASTEIKCDIQFTADYLIKTIQAIKAAYNDLPLPVSEPHICNVLPSAINMNLPANQRNLVAITGYFLTDDFSKYTLQHHTISGSVTNKTSSLSTSSPFKLQVNLGSGGITLNTNSGKLVLLWDGHIVSEIPVIQHQPEPCEIRERELGNLPQMMVYPEHKKDPRIDKSKGDREFQGHGPCTTGNVRIFTKNNGTELWARVFVRMWECPDNLKRSREDYSYGDKTQEMKLVNADLGWRIKTIKQSTYESFQNIDRVCDATEPFSGSGVVSTYLIKGDLSGDDLGSSYVQVTFRPVKVTLEKIGNCISN